MSTIVILTNNFPHAGGEEFLATELPHWTGRGDLVVLAPAYRRSSPLPVLPGDVRVDYSLALLSGVVWAGIFSCAALMSPMLWREARHIAKGSRSSPRVWWSIWRLVARTLRAHVGLSRLLAKQGQVDLVYSYWKDAEAYAAARLRGRRRVPRLVTRAHGFDLYRQRRPGRHMPLARQYAGRFDHVFPVSRDGVREYLAQVGPEHAPRVTMARLGVALPTQRAATSDDGRLHLLSMSNCVPVKRIDHLIQSLALLATARPDLTIRWTHIGDGPFRRGLHDLADTVLGPIPTLSHCFTGQLPHESVLSFMATEPVDLFLNTSESEGVPVSMMEAMSYGIPCIAPDVGGIRELLGEAAGWIVRAPATPHRMAPALVHAAALAKTGNYRAAARKRVECDFAAIVTFPEFVRRCHSLILAPDQT